MRKVLKEAIFVDCRSAVCWTTRESQIPDWYVRLATANFYTCPIQRSRHMLPAKQYE